MFHDATTTKKRNITMKKPNTKVSKKIAVTMMTAIIACAIIGCSQEKTAATQTETTQTAEEKVELVTYEFETFDNLKIVLDESSITAQEPSDDPENSELISAEAAGNIIAPGRDFVYLEDSNNYYVADYSRNLVTVADKNKAKVEVIETKEAAADFVEYEFETFDGLTIKIHAGIILSQEPCEEPLEWEGLPADAEQIAPGRDCILFADSTNYYVEDVTNKLVTTAFQELGDVIEETDFAIFDNNVFTFRYDPEYFVVNEDDKYVTVSFYNEGIQTAGSNTITFTENKNADSMDVAKEYAKQYGVDEKQVQKTNFGSADAEAYSFSISPTDGSESGNKTRTMVCAVQNGDNVIVIEVLNHVEPDEGMDIMINDKIAEVLDTFSLI